MMGYSQFFGKFEFMWSMQVARQNGFGPQGNPALPDLYARHHDSCTLELIHRTSAVST